MLTQKIDKKYWQFSTTLEIFYSQKMYEKKRFQETAKEKKRIQNKFNNTKLQYQWNSTTPNYNINEIQQHQTKLILNCKNFLSSII